MSADIVGEVIFNTIVSACVYALVAVGISIVFGLTGLVNFAQGAMMMFGAYVAYAVTSHGGWSFSIVIIVATLAVVLLSVALTPAFLKTISRPVNGFIISLGLIAILENGITRVAGADPVTIQPAFTRNWTLGGVTISQQDVLTIAIAVAVFCALAFVLKRTRAGLALRASADDREMAGLLGVPIWKMVIATFVVGGALAGLGGAMVAGFTSLTPRLGGQYILTGFTVAIVGGLGNVWGAVVAAFVVAVVTTSMATAGLGQWVEVGTFGVMILILLFRPTGVFRGVEHAQL